MCAIEIAIRIYHFGLHPQAEIHAEGIYACNQAVQAIRKLLRIDGPIAQSRVIVVSFAKPAVVHDEQFHTELGGLFCERYLSRFVHVKFGGFPRVVENRSRPRFEATRLDVAALQIVQQARRLTKPCCE